MPIVSVIIPTYNRFEFLIKTLESIQNQTLTDIEILVCDDGSTDETEKYVKRIQEQDKRVRYFNCGHYGRPSVPRNVGISNSYGEWLAFDDDDDIWLPEKLEVQLSLAKKNNVKAICSNAFIVENGVNTGRKFFNTNKDSIYSFKDLIDINPVINSSMMIHRSLLVKCIGYPESEILRAIEDYAFWMRVACYTRIYFDADSLVGYLIFSDSSIRYQEMLSFEETKRIIDNDFNEWIKNQGTRIFLYVEKEKTYRFFIRMWEKVLRKIHRICEVMR